MAKDNLIISGFVGYRQTQIKPYVESIAANVPGCKLVMAVAGTDSETLKYLHDRGWETINLPMAAEIPVHVMRFLAIYDYLKDHWQDYNLVISTDVKDVVFQSNPFDWLSQHLVGNYKLVAGSESIRYCHEPWGNDNLLQTYGEYVHSQFKNNVIYNVGTLGGYSEYIKDLTFNIFFNSIQRPIPIVDQAVFNVLLQTQPYKDVTLFAEQRLGWACQAGTVVDPAKIASFRPYLTEPEPVWRDGRVLTSDGLRQFAIVHQYDRVPSWRDQILNNYRNKNEF